MARLRGGPQPEFSMIKPAAFCGGDNGENLPQQLRTETWLGMERRETLDSVDDTDETRNFEKIALIGLSGILCRKYSAAIFTCLASHVNHDSVTSLVISN